MDSQDTTSTYKGTAWTPRYMEWTPRGLKSTTRPQLALQQPKMDFQMSKTDSQWPKIDSRRSKNRLLNSQIWLKEAQNRLPGSNINLQEPRIDFHRPKLYTLILKARRPKIDSHIRSTRYTSRVACHYIILYIYPPGSKSEALQLGVLLILLYFIRIWSWVRRLFFYFGSGWWMGCHFLVLQISLY